MEDQQLYGSTMLDIAPMLEDFPFDLYEQTSPDNGSFKAVESEILSPALEPLEHFTFTPHTETGSPQYGNFVDPDMFLNGVIKRESESDCSNSSHRNTPSPADSQQSLESHPSSGYGSCQSVLTNNILFDSPPVSPETFSNPPQIVSAPQSNVIRIGAAQLPTVQMPCPTNLADLKKIKLPMKRPATTGAPTGAASKSFSKKTIVLTAKDYQTLIQNMKNQAKPGTILIKTAPTSAFTAAHKEKPVLPKPQLINTLPAQKVIAPTSVLSTEEVPDIFQATTNLPGAPAVQTPTESTRDERAVKKHQRMIKNRESAYLSRVRKKEYVTSLEQLIDTLTQENQQLKNENLKILEKLRNRCSCGKSYANSISKQITPTVRKNTAIVLAMLFMVSLNFGPFGTLMSNSNNNEQNDDLPIPHHKRNLLWLDESSVYNARNIDVILNMTDFENLERSAEESFSICPFYVNQTENIRLASELRRWIGENGFKNLTDNDGDDMSINSFSEMFALKDTIDSMYRQMKDLSSQMESFKKRTKQTNAKRKHQLKTKKARELQLYQQQKIKRQNELGFYYTGFNKKYARFFEEIGRRDDTFYLVSFSAEHLLLPALAYNKTSRPKMSLMLPALMENGTHSSEKVTLMQIDCEVMNTSMIQIREKTIPGDLLRSHNKMDDVKKANAADFTSNVQNISSSDTTRKGDGKFKNPSIRPFFVQRMSEHIKDDFDTN